MRYLANIFLSVGFAAAAILPAGATVTSAAAPGGKYHECHGYIRHVSMQNVRVHCIDGTPKDLSFLSWPKYAEAPGGRTIQEKDLKPGTPVHIYFTQSLGIRHVYKVFVANPRGHGLFGFKG